MAMVLRVHWYTGLDRLYYLMPYAWQARHVAKRAGGGPVVVELPGRGGWWSIEDGRAVRTRRPDLPTF